MRRARVLLVVAVWCGCNGSAPTAKPRPAATGGSAATPAASGAPRDASATLPAPAAGSASDERCATPCRFLDAAPLVDVADAFQRVCGAAWPVPGPKDCDQLDFERNCIYAVNGHAFKRKKWRDAFGALAWYKPAAKESDLSATARANVAALKRQAHECRNAPAQGGVHDRRVDAWLAGLARGKPEIPAVALDTTGRGPGTALTADQMTHALVIDKHHFKAGNSPVTTGTPSAAVQTQLAASESVSAFVVLASGCADDNDECAGSTITLVFEGDKLVALENFTPSDED